MHNDVVIFESASTESSREFLKQAYQYLDLKYPKFHKMDLLSKLGIVAGELLVGNEEESALADLGIVMANRSSSLQIDEDFAKTIRNEENFFPSPSLFVYTLPNIVIGEICIRHKIKGENAFFILNKFDPCFIDRKSVV